MLRSHLNLISSKHWLGSDQRENNEENNGNIEVTTLISKLQTRCIIARGKITYLSDPEITKRAGEGFIWNKDSVLDAVP